MIVFENVYALFKSNCLLDVIRERVVFQLLNLRWGYSRKIANIRRIIRLNHPVSRIHLRINFRLSEISIA